MKIGWIGTGIMGSSMCGHLIDAGHELTVYNRTVEKTAASTAKGAALGSNPAETARDKDVVFSIVGYPSDVEEIYFGDDGILSAAAHGSVLVDMTTSSPPLALRIAEAAKIK